MHAYRDGRAPGPGAGRSSSASSPSSSRPPAPARTSRCCSPTTRAPSSSSPSARTPRWWSSSTRAASGMASTFLTRLRVGGKLVDAKGVSQLYRCRISNLSLAVMLLVGLLRPVRRPGRHPPAAPPCCSWSVPGGTTSWSLDRRDLHVIDFRYHLVSIVSIFLALAVGIVLGAGPLKEDLGNTADPRAHPAAAGQDRPARPTSPQRSRASAPATPGPRRSPQGRGRGR